MRAANSKRYEVSWKRAMADGVMETIDFEDTLKGDTRGNRLGVRYNYRQRRTLMGEKNNVNKLF